MRPEPHVLRRAVAIASASAVLVAAGCTGERPRLSDEPQVTSTTPDPDEEAEPPPDPATLAAESTTDAISIYPDATSTEADEELTADDATSTPGSPIVFLVVREQGERFEVQLPTEAPGTTGWVDKADVEVVTITYRVQVLLDDHRLRVFDADDEVVVDQRITVGDDEPDPGEYFLTELLEAPDPDGPYGDHAYVLSGSTTTEAAFESGRGLVGIHAGADEDDLGEDTGSGCVGVTGDVMEQLIEEIGLQLGTPVQIVA